VTDNALRAQAALNIESSFYKNKSDQASHVSGSKADYDITNK
jgi:hypothetical protein